RARLGPVIDSQALTRPGGERAIPTGDDVDHRGAFLACAASCALMLRGETTPAARVGWASAPTAPAGSRMALAAISPFAGTSRAERALRGAKGLRDRLDARPLDEIEAVDGAEETPGDRALRRG